MKVIIGMLNVVVIASMVVGIQSCNSSSSKKTTETESKSCCDTKEEVATEKSCCSEKKVETKSCCSSSTQVAKGDVHAYYFHATRRCATCEAVEKITAETLKNKYQDNVSFTSINREEEKENPLLSKYKVEGQTLILVKGDKVINLTTDAFMNARSNPEKFSAKLVSTVESLLN